jgi:DNA repair exonuclease SbcCD ATPase subunit
MMEIQTYLNKIQRARGKLEVLEASAIQLEKDFAKTNKLLAALEEAQAFIQLVAKETQEQLKFHVVDVVQLALDTCFPGEYLFDVLFEIKRGRTEAQLVFKKNDIEVDPMEASGGGVVDLAAFALRISAWSLGHTDNVLIFDEPFRFLSRDLQPRAGEIMKKLSKHLGLQMILVTHNQAIIDSADRIFEVTQKDGVSKVTMRDN